MTTPIVVTTINEPTEQILKLSRLPGCSLIVVGDNKTPRSWTVPGSTYLSIEEQLEGVDELSHLLPQNHYARKNVGYLAAFEQNPAKIAETDDDNEPTNWRISEIESSTRADHLTETGWVNIYRFFTDEKVWPRGFPLELINVDNSGVPAVRTTECVIHQFLAEGDPDVDAIYRLTVGKTDHSFRAGTVTLGPGSITPFNSQSTIWFPPAYMYMYLPSLVSFRMTDIWRSFVALACIHSEGFSLAYHGNGVFQDRNDHDLMRDFRDEIGGYNSNAEIVDLLLSLPLSGQAPSEKLRMCYSALVDRGVVPEAELPLVDAWITDFASANRGQG